ncbi:MAG: hypothetical protein AMXMBFR13_51390 [Phycisphaerae bacterium]
MNRPDADQRAAHSDHLTRRDFLHAGSIAAAGLAVAPQVVRQASAGVPRDAQRSCIFLFLVGGPSHIDTFDPKPDAPAEIRGPYRPIRTNVRGIQISELLPRTARQADKYAIVRSMQHTAPAVHDTGHQMLQTGHLFGSGLAYPHVGCVYGMLKGSRSGLPAHLLLPRPIGHTGGRMPHGQDAGFLGRAHDPFVLNADPADPDLVVPGLSGVFTTRLNPQKKGYERHGPIARTIAHIDSAGQAENHGPENYRQARRLMAAHQARDAFDLSREPHALRDAYGRNRFGQSCLLARRLIERGVRFVTVNMFETVFNEVTWDIHGSAPFGTIECYRESVGPMFDHAYSMLLEDLHARGLLQDTLVVATGEFGRTPRINPAGGRDHWPQCWSMLFAGGGVKGGQVIGASDAQGAFPKDRPTQPAEAVASIYHGLGIDLSTRLAGPDGRQFPLLEEGVRSIHELF